MELLDFISIAMHFFVDSSAMLLNFLLLYVILKYSPKSVYAYKVLLINTAITEGLSAFMALFLIQRHIPVPPLSLIYISHGLCSYLGSQACYMGYAIMLHTYSHSLLSLLLSFGFRHYVMIKKSPQLRTILFLTFLFLLPSAISTVTFSFCGSPDVDLLPILKQHYPQYETAGMVISGHINLFTPLGLVTVVLICAITPLTYPFILYFRWATLKKIGEGTFSEKTKKLHKELMKALTFQAMLPALYVFSVISFGLGQLGVVNHPFFENFTFEIVDWVPFFSPICTFYVIGPYRRALLDIFTVIKNRGGKVNPNTYNMSFAHDKKLPEISLQTAGTVRDSSNTNGGYHLNSA